MYSTLLLWIFTATLNSVYAKIMEAITCNPPDFPEFGGYGPVEDSYNVGDVVYYYCDTFAQMNGRAFQKCNIYGEWLDRSPTCDPAARLEDAQQTSTAEPFYKNEALNAIDSEKSTCTSTAIGPDQVWTAQFAQRSTFLKIRLLVPPGNVSHVVRVLTDKQEINCEVADFYVERHVWITHKCVSGVPNAVSVKIVSKSENHPLKLCEVVPYTVPTVNCPDPKILVENGHMMISRNKATLLCKSGFTKRQNSVINCMQQNADGPIFDNGIWERKRLYCTPSAQDVEDIKADTSGVQQKDKDKQC